MPPLEIPEELEDAIGIFASIDHRDEGKLESYSQTAELVSAYVQNAQRYARFPRDTRQFADSVSRSLKSLNIYLDMATYNDAFGVCAKQWRETMEHTTEFLTNLMGQLDEQRLRAATTTKPVTAKDIRCKARAVKSILTGTKQLQADEQVTLVGDAFGRVGFVRVESASGERAVVSLVNLASIGDNAELLTFFTSSVEKMKQCVEQVRKEVASKFWALARSYFQSRSKKDIVTLVDAKRWKMATDLLMKLEDENSTGFSFKPCINAILNNVIAKKLPGSFEISPEEADNLYEFIHNYQTMMALLSQFTISLKSVQNIWGEDWQGTLLRKSSLQVLQASTSHLETPDRTEYHLHTVQQQQQRTSTTTRRFVASSSHEWSHSIEANLNHQQQQQHSQRSMQSVDSLLQQLNQHQHQRTVTDTAEIGGDVFRVPSSSRRSSVTSDSSKRQQQRTVQHQQSPLLSPAIMSAKMVDVKDTKRGIMDDFCCYEVRERDVNTMTDGIAIISEAEMLEQRSQLQEARRLLAKLETRAPRADVECQTDTPLDVVDAKMTAATIVTESHKSVRFSLPPAVTDAGCHSDWLPTVSSSMSVGKEIQERLTLCHTHAAIVRDTGANSDISLKNNFAVCDTETTDKQVRHHFVAPVAQCAANLEIGCKNNFAVCDTEMTDKQVRHNFVAPVAQCAANLEIGCKNSLASFSQPVKSVASSSVSIGEELVCSGAAFRVPMAAARVSVQQERAAVSSTHASRIVEFVAQSASARVEQRAANCRTVVAAMANAEVTFRPVAADSNMLSLGKPIVDNGVFRINEMTDSWTDAPTNKPTDSGAHYCLARRDVKTQKNATRPPQVECGVGGNPAQLASGNMAVQTIGGTAGGGLVMATDCGASGESVARTDAGRSRKTRGTDMSERQTICDTGVSASSKTVVETQSEELVLRQKEQLQQQEQRQQQRDQLQRVYEQQKQQLEMLQKQHEQGQQQREQLQRVYEQQKQRYELLTRRYEELQQQSSKLAAPQEMRSLVDTGAWGQTTTLVTMTAKVEPGGRRRSDQIKPASSEREVSTVETRMRQLYANPPADSAVDLRDKKPPQPQTRKQDVPDKEWRYPVHRQDFRPDPDSLPKPQLVFADTGLPLASPSSPSGRESAPPPPMTPPPMTPPPPQRAEVAREETRKPRHWSLPRLRKKQSKRQQREQEQQHQSEMPQAVVMESIQTRVEPGVWQAPRQQWSSRSLHLGTGGVAKQQPPASNKPAGAAASDSQRALTNRSQLV